MGLRVAWRGDTGETARRILREYSRKGLGEAEVFVSIRERRGVETRDGRPEAVSITRSTVASIRVVSNGATAFASTTDLSSGGCSELIRRVAPLGGLADRDKAALLPAGRGGVTGEVSDETLRTVDDAGMEEYARRLEAAARLRGISRVRKPSFRIDAEEVAILSTRGVDARFARSRWSMSIMAVAEGKGGMVSSWEGSDGVRLEDADPEEVGRRAGAAALAKRGGRRCPTGRFPVVIDAMTAVALVELVGSAASAEAVILGRSFLAGLAGRRWGGAGVTIVDDGLLPGGVGSRPADDEGVPCTRTVIVGKGKVRGYLHNTRSAARMGVASTGNAIRPGPFAPPGIGATNLSLLPGDEADLATLAGKAIEITELLGLHTANPVTGEVSVGIEGFLLEEGRRKHPVKGGGMGTTLGELFGGVLAIGRESRTLDGISSPAFLTSPLAVSG